MSDGDQPRMVALLEEHGSEIEELVKREAVVAYRAHQQLREENPDAAALIAPSDLLPKVDDALGWLRDRVSDQEDATNISPSEIIGRDERSDRGRQ